MKTLKFAPNLVPLILSGEKTSTWRVFDEKNLQVHDQLTFINKETGEEFVQAVIVAVREKRLGDITTEDEVSEGHERFRTDQDRLETYQKYYGDLVTADTAVKMLRYELLEKATGLRFMQLAAVEARKALCLARQCGVVIVKGGVLIGAGHNGPPKDDLSIRHCDSSMPDSCVHAEWRAIMNGLRQHSEAMIGSVLYFTAVDTEGNILKSGKPYCTVCSRLALDVGIVEFVLWHEDGITVYETDEYNRISYENAIERAKMVKT